jgi:hypothetical protein
MKLSIEGKKIVFTFEGCTSLVFDREQVTNAEAIDAAVMLGFSNKLRDCAALERKDKAGNVVNVTEQMRRDAVAPMVEHFHSGGGWTVKRIAAQNATIVAIAAKLGITYSEAEAKVAEQMLAGLA